MSWKPECGLNFNMVWRILVNFIRQPMLRLKTHSGFHDLFIKYIITSHLLYNHRVLQSLILVSSSLPFVYGEVLLGWDCYINTIFIRKSTQYRNVHNLSTKLQQVLYDVSVAVDVIDSPCFWIS
jgi:hypothetical protein